MDEQRELLEGMLYRMKRTYELNDASQADIAITQAYSNCMIALQLERIANALEALVKTKQES